MTDPDSDDEPLTLSTTALGALQSFYADRDALAKKFSDLKSAAEDEFEGTKEEKKLSMEVFQEDWNSSQFWYDEGTAGGLGEELLGLRGKEEDGKWEGKGWEGETIAFVSAPSVFVGVRNLFVEHKIPVEKRPKLVLLEFDTRFDVFPEFVFYDFKNPWKLPPGLKGSVDHIICDPPFLSEDCQTKAAMTVRWLSKSWGGEISTKKETSRLILCTGERMSPLINKLYRPQGIQTTTYEPKHSKGLSNEFLCYANFECGKWSFREEEE